MKVLRTLVCEIAAILMVVGFLCVGAQRTQAQTTFTNPPFPISIGTGLQVNGSATVSTTTPNYLQLTPASGDKVGSAWYTNPAGPAPAPLSLLNGFTTTFTFQFTGQGGINNSTAGSNGKTGADGIAFVVQNGCFTYNDNNYCKSSAVAQNTGAGGEIGFTGLTNSVAVEFDTWCNSEYGDTCASTASPTSADQITVESCGANANTVNHSAGCSFGTVDLSRLTSPLYIGDGNIHTAQVSYSPPTVAGTCTVTSILGANGCGSLAVFLDGRPVPVLIVPFNLTYLGLDGTDDAYVGFTGATGGAWETQDVLSWNFMAGVTSVVTQSVNTSNGTSNVNLPAILSTTTGQVLNTDINFLAPGGLNFQNNVTSPVLITTNNALSVTDTWPQYVVGTPWATSQCTVKAANGGSTLCSLYINACFQSNTNPSTASDANCPTVATPSTDNYVVLLDQFDWPEGGKIPILNGATVSLIDFTPTMTPPELWSPTTLPNPLGATVNPVCQNVSGTGTNGAPGQCDISDTVIYMYGDQTTTKGSKPKSKGWLISAVNVPMLLTTVNTVAPTNSTLKCSALPLNDATPSDPNYGNPAVGASIWNNGACLLDFSVSPASIPPGYTGIAPYNNFQPAPPYSITYGSGPGDPAAPATTDATYLNPSPVLPSCTVGTVPCIPATWVTGGLMPLNSSFLFPSDGPNQILHWSAKDTVGITEKLVYLVPSTSPFAINTCYYPSDQTLPAPSDLQPPCYNTQFFTTTVNIDSVAPALTSQGCVQTPAGPNGKNGWYITDVSAICYASDATSGIQTATVATTPSVPVNGPNANVKFNLSTAVGAGNANTAAMSTSSETLCDFAQNCNLPAISIGPFQIDEAPPTISTLTFSAASPYTVGQSVTAGFTCADVGSGVASCLGNGSGTNGAMVNTLTTGTYTFTVTATDIAGNVTTSSVNYTVNPAAPAADVAIGGGVTSNTAKSVTYDAWVLDLTKSASASNVVMTFQITAPAGVVGGPIKGVVADVSCSLFGCSAVPPSGGSSCSVTSNNGYTTNTVTCVVGALASVYNLKGAAAQITIPIASTAKVGTQFGISGTVSSANDPNPKNNTTSTTITVK
jgi:hypothetical protein